MSSVDDLFGCPICSHIINEAVETPCCHKCYCEKCLDLWLGKSSTCPECRSNIRKEDVKASMPLRRMISNLNVDCPNRAKGCTDVVTRGTLKEHEAKCSYAPIPCRFSSECPLVYRVDIEKHESECKYRHVQCAKCSKDGIPLNKMEEHLAKDCEEALLTCNRCSESVARKNYKDHETRTCLELDQQCMYSKHGCEFKGKRRDLLTHEEQEMRSHLLLVTNQLAVSEKTNAKLLARVNELQVELAKMKENTVSSLNPSLQFSPMKHLPYILPSHLVAHKSNLISLDADNLGATLKEKTFALSVSNPGGGFCVRANALIPAADTCVYYFEMFVENPGKQGAIAIGIVSSEHDLMGMPGWSKGYGYHGDDGKKFGDSSNGESYGVTYGKDDYVGVLWDQKQGNVFFTKNGVNLGIAFRGVHGQYYPVIGLHSPQAKLRVNFGKEPFKYKINV